MDGTPHHLAAPKDCLVEYIHLDETQISDEFLQVWMMAIPREWGRLPDDIGRQLWRVNQFERVAPQHDRRAYKIGRHPHPLHPSRGMQNQSIARDFCR